MRTVLRDVNWQDKWHPWFAWRPVTVSAGTMRVRVWLEKVQRKGEWVGGYEGNWNFTYRLDGVKDDT